MNKSYPVIKDLPCHGCLVDIGCTNPEYIYVHVRVYNGYRVQKNGKKKPTTSTAFPTRTYTVYIENDEKGYILAYKYTDSLIWWLISHNFPKDAAVIKIKAEDIPKI